MVLCTQTGENQCFLSKRTAHTVKWSVKICKKWSFELQELLPEYTFNPLPKNIKTIWSVAKNVTFIILSYGQKTTFTDAEFDTTFFFHQMCRLCSIFCLSDKWGNENWNTYWLHTLSVWRHTSVSGAQMMNFSILLRLHHKESITH